MSGPKFASITASLLARKGEAQPWNHTGNPSGTSLNNSSGVPQVPESAAESAVEPVTDSWAEPSETKVAYPWRTREAGGTPPTPPPPAKEKSCMMRMSAHDFERLGILGIKTGATRAQLLKDALSEFLANRADEYGCSCLGACENNCGDL